MKIRTKEEALKYVKERPNHIKITGMADFMKVDQSNLRKFIWEIPFPEKHVPALIKYVNFMCAR